MHARDREHVREPRAAHIVLVGRRQRVRIAEHEVPASVVSSWLSRLRMRWERALWLMAKLLAALEKWEVRARARKASRALAEIFISG